MNTFTNGWRAHDLAMIWVKNHMSQVKSKQDLLKLYLSADHYFYSKFD